jgi:hypothetical protein
MLYRNGRLRKGAELPVDRRGKKIRPGKLREGAAAIAADGPFRCIFRNNLIHHNHHGGIVLFRGDAVNYGEHNRIYHNTIYMPKEFRNVYGVKLAVTTQHTRFRNNIIVTADAPCIWLGRGASRGFHSDYNYMFRLDDKEVTRRERDDYSLQRWQKILRQDRASQRVRPLFVDPDNPDPNERDFRLQKSSRLPGRAQFVNEVPNDILGNWRHGRNVTPGCYEMRPSKVNPNQHHKRRPKSHKRPGAKPDKPPTETPKPPPDDGIILPPID